MSEKGWIRAAKGHDIEAESLSYKSGDSFLFAVKGKNSQNIVILDSTGRGYTLPTHNLPSARSQGEPITGKINAPSGVDFIAGIMGNENERYLLSTDAGYGFVAQLSELISKNKAGKAIISVPDGALILPPQKIDQLEQATIVTISNEGRLLLFAASELPELSKGKGNKMLSVNAARVKSREEFMEFVAVMNNDDSLVIQAGKRTLTLKMSDLEHYRGERGRRGNKLPRGFQKVDQLEVKVNSDTWVI